MRLNRKKGIYCNKCTNGGLKACVVQVGCTCILQPFVAIPYNASSDDVALLMLGERLPLRFFEQIVFPYIFREKLDLRIPSSVSLAKRLVNYRE